MTVNAVIFDLDGTLADTLRDIAEAVNHALTTVGLPTHPVGQFAAWVGDGLPMLCQRAIGTTAAVGVDDVTRLAADHYREHHMDHTDLYPGVAALLDELQRRSLAMGVLSNKPHEFTVRMVDALCTRWSFRAVQGSNDGLERKPHPQPARHVCAQLGVTPQRCVFVGDTAIDIQTARNAEMISIGVTWGFRDVAELREACADHIIDQPAELLAVLEQYETRAP